MARPTLEIDWNDVEKLCALQCTQEEIAQFCDCSVDTLDRAAKRDHDISFAEFFRQKRGKGKISLRRKQWEVAQKGNVTMLIWLGKQYLDQSEKKDGEKPADPNTPEEQKIPPGEYLKTLQAKQGKDPK